MKTKLFGLLVLAAGCFALPVSAEPVISSFSGGSSYGIYYGGSSGDMVGFSFTADTDLTVTDLGVMNDPVDGILDSAHMVGLWDATSLSLLASVLVDSDDSLLDGFFYASLGAAVNLAEGNRYLLAALYTANDGDSYTSMPVSVDSLYISETRGVFPVAQDLGFQIPGNTSDSLARFGANMLAAPTIVEPGTLLLLGLGLIGVSAVRRPKR